ncbi:MAG: AMMECR1 domain-containing protein [Leptospiraceae bacterium]|nr:AMMECR1 domain-containing protein [Leptospiraceae bacterium]
MKFLFLSKNNFLSIICLLLLNLPLFSVETEENEWRKFFLSPNKKEFSEYARCLLSSDICEQKISHPFFSGKLGLFVTLKKSNQIRGCFGAFHHNSSEFLTLLKEYMQSAKKDDPRYIELTPKEFSQTAIIITLAFGLQKVSIDKEIDFKNLGIYLSSLNKVYVPGEIRSLKSFRSIMSENSSKEVFTFQAITFTIPKEDK